MAHLRCDFFSESLSHSTSMTVLLPQRTTTRIGMAGHPADGPPPVLYLLHGLSDDDTIWLRRTSIERYAAPLGLAVVMPQAQRGFYTDQAYGGRYWTFLTAALPGLLCSLFRVSVRREDTFVAGLSMGGYGAFTWALRQPDRFAAAANLSGAVDITGLRTGRQRPEDPRTFERIRRARACGRSGRPALAARAGGRRGPAGALPLLRHRGWADRGRHRLPGRRPRRRGDGTADFGPGAHDWAYWDARIQDVLAWLPLGART